MLAEAHVEASSEECMHHVVTNQDAQDMANAAGTSVQHARESMSPRPPNSQQFGPSHV